LLLTHTDRRVPKSFPSFHRISGGDSFLRRFKNQLQTLETELDAVPIAQDWGTIHRIQNILLPSLKNRQNKYHTFMAEKVIEVVEYY
jgi:hypothetical protein